MTPFDALAGRLKAGGVPFRREVPLAGLTWLGVGGSAPILAEPRHEGDLDLLYREAAALGVRLECLGSGANLLVDDGPLPFAVLRLTAEPFRRIALADGVLTVGAGTVLESAVWKAVEAGLAGMEGLVGIPATVGGALAMNAGGRHAEIGPLVRRVRAAGPGGMRELSGEACGFAYRRSGLGGLTVVEAELVLAPGDAPALAESARGIRDAKRRTQPLQDASAGCMFKNPSGDSAGRLIEAAGMKGVSQGRAAVSSLHANFLVNLGGATADDIRCLVERVRDAVRRVHGVDLEPEVVRWP